MSDFPFVSDEALRTNLDQAFELILELVSLSISKEYSSRTPLISSLRKTIIISTASIIEALMLWRLKQVCTSGEVELSDDWKYVDVRVLHELTSSEQIIGCKRVKERKEVGKLDFNRIIDISFNNSVLSGDELKSDLTKIRRLRNRLHIGTLAQIDRQYRPSDLEFCFSVLENIKTKFSNQTSGSQI